MKNALFVGEMLIDFIPNQSLLDASHPTVAYQPHPGGAPANAAVALARLGGSARFVGKLADDTFGHLLRQTLAENQVDTRFAPLTRQGPTTITLVTLQQDGRREFTFYRQQTADTLLTSEDLVPQMWENTAVCHAGSLLLASEPARSASLSVLEQARERNLLVSFDVNIRPSLWASEADMRETLAQVVPRVDLLKFSLDEAHYLDPTLSTPLDPGDRQSQERLSQKLLAQGPRLIIMTSGSEGALFLTERQSVHVPGSKITAIDTTGAGDAFMGATLHQFLTQGWITAGQLATLHEEDLKATGTFANCVAGISCTRHGGIASLPFLAEVLQASRDVQPLL